MSLRGLIVLIALVALTGTAQEVVVRSIEHNGSIAFSGVDIGTTASVSWASSLNEPGRTNWHTLSHVVVTNNPMLADIPMFFRVTLWKQPSPPTTPVEIPAGQFPMGNCMDALEGTEDELPVHAVHVDSFFMDACEVTKALWDEVYTWAITNGYSFENAGAGKTGNHPVHSVNWYDAVKWCNARSERDGLIPAYYTSAALTTAYRTGRLNVSNEWVRWSMGYRLPTEAEWEKAARGASSGHRFPWTDVDSIQHTRANYCSIPLSYGSYNTELFIGYHPSFAVEPEPYTSPIGCFAPNGYGLFDMAGNVTEWCWDWYSDTYYSLYATNAWPSSPVGPSTGVGRVLRGGAWSGAAPYQRCSSRDGYFPHDVRNTTGFRCVRP